MNWTKMPFEYKESILPQYLRHIPDSVNLNKTNYAEAKLVRLLLGTCKIKSTNPNITLSQNRNYCDALGTINANPTSRTLKNLIAPLTLNDVDIYLDKVKNTNFSLFNDLLVEFSYFYLNTNQGNHTSAFIHLFRILEYISYSFPLVHASTSKNYYGTFNSLKSFFTQDGGELNFLIKFVNKLFETDPILNTMVDIEVRHITEPAIQTKIYKGYKKVLNWDIITFDDTTEIFSFEYQHFIEIIRSLRNRYFHFAIGGQKNIRSSEIEYPDLFFKQINIYAINWLSIVYFEIFKAMVYRWK